MASFVVALIEQEWYIRITTDINEIILAKLANGNVPQALKFYFTLPVHYSHLLSNVKIFFTNHFARGANESASSRIIIDSNIKGGGLAESLQRWEKRHCGLFQLFKF